ncbi:DUF6678 family protein [Cohnella lupini]|uniref:Uncharacterized protein n=1 Tax=Cohnella lupini TaxID=1294267 RepID=A0A3D9HQ49_9BACL|nr:DUF6678 family protein [Cohnella lupini]RED51633.1 hypothetical protein DFP95_1428 [Cohnella lupini]
MVSKQDFKKRVHDVVTQKQLSSIMNDTKWGNLQKAVLNTLPFAPPFQAKYVLDESLYPENFENDVWYLGDWVEGLSPFYSVEWIRVRPKYQKPLGKILPPELIDITNEFLSILQKLRIPYKEENNTFFIYGYISNTDSLSYSTGTIVQTRAADTDRWSFLN